MSEHRDLKKRKAPEDRIIVQHSTEVTAHAGPIPSPADFADYDRILPGSANRILTMAEKEQEMTHFAIKAAIEHETRLHTTLRFTAIPILMGGFVLVLVRADLASYSILIGELAALIGAFIYSKKSEQK
jgi:uncharacterized membrane protein